jgi:hypothetical protein
MLHTRDHGYSTSWPPRMSSFQMETLYFFGRITPEEACICLYSALRYYRHACDGPFYTLFLCSGFISKGSGGRWSLEQAWAIGLLLIRMRGPVLYIEDLHHGPRVPSTKICILKALFWVQVFSYYCIMAWSSYCFSSYSTSLFVLLYFNLECS